jgi:hypothetical protein
VSILCKEQKRTVIKKEKWLNEKDNNNNSSDTILDIHAFYRA